MSKLNLGGQITGQSTFITNGITIRSNSNINVSQNIDQNTFKTLDTDITITVNDSIGSSSIGDIKIKSDDGLLDLITISGGKIDSVDIPAVDSSSETYGYSFKQVGGTVNLIEISTSLSASIQKSAPGGVSQTTIKN